MTKKKARNRIKLAVFDLAGTTVDYGSRAPAGVFCELFRRHGIDATEAEARIPMGKHKRDHIAEMLAMQSIAEQWLHEYGSNWSSADVDALFDEFVALQLEALSDYTDAIPGAAETIRKLAEMGIRTAATTGYNNEMTGLLLRKLAAQDVVFDFACCAAEVAAGRPRPWMIYRCMEALDAYPACSVINIGDTIADVESGVNAGVWSVGVAKTGNMLGLSEEEVDRLNEKERASRLAAAGKSMRAVGADAVIESVADVPELMLAVAGELDKGRQPGSPHGIAIWEEPVFGRLLEREALSPAPISQR